MKVAAIKRISLILMILLFSATFYEAKAQSELTGLSKETYIVLGVVGGLGLVAWLIISIVKSHHDKSAQKDTEENSSIEAKRVYEQFLAEKQNAIQLHSNGDFSKAAKQFRSFKKAVEENKYMPQRSYNATGIGPTWQGLSPDEENEIRRQLYSDTIGIGDSISVCLESFKNTSEDSIPPIKGLYLGMDYENAKIALNKILINIQNKYQDEEKKNNVTINQTEENISSTSSTEDKNYLARKQYTLTIKDGNSYSGLIFISCPELKMEFSWQKKCVNIYIDKNFAKLLFSAQSA